ncbi:MAG: discoidin domain-containing protein, partial [Akkermansiaceae bacterium]
HTTDDEDLDALLDSHSWLGGNPAEVSVTLNNLVVGKTYQVQLIGVGDNRGCCSGRTYEADNGAGVYDTGFSFSRGDVSSMIGTFDADDTTQVILWRSLNNDGGNNDPGFSGIVVLQLQDLTDTDGDGLFDQFEIDAGLDPNDDDSDDNGTLDGEEDGDGDGLNNLGEQTAGTDPTYHDSDDDTLLDGVETGTGVWNSVADTGTNPLSNDSDGDGLLDNVENPDLPYVDENQTGSDPNIVDTDNDTLPDDVEVAINSDPSKTDTDGNGTLDGDEDADNDSSTNSNELVVGTDPANDDTDDDGFLDGVETNTGIWVSATNTGTNPLDNDTDDDGLLDGVENPDLPFADADQTGSDPHTVDTDGDLAGDGFEIENSTDPTNPNDTPDLPTISIIDGLLGGDLTDPEDDGIDIEDTAGENFNWVSITSSSESFFTDATAGGSNEGAFDVFDNKVGGGEAKWCCNAAPQDLTVEFAEPVSITYFTMTSSNDSPDRDPTFWQIQGSNDGITFETIFDHTGDPIWDARNQTALFILDSPAVAYRFIRYSVTQTGGTLHALGEIEYFGLVGGTPLDITDIEYNDDNSISLTWNSNPGRTYTVQSNVDLGSFWEDVQDSIPAAGDGATQTSVTFPSPPPVALKRFFRVVEE